MWLSTLFFGVLGGGRGGKNTGAYHTAVPGRRAKLNGEEEEVGVLITAVDRWVNQTRVLCSVRKLAPLFHAHAVVRLTCLSGCWGRRARALATTRVLHRIGSTPLQAIASTCSWVYCCVHHRALWHTSSAPLEGTIAVAYNDTVCSNSRDYIDTRPDGLTNDNAIGGSSYRTPRTSCRGGGITKHNPNTHTPVHSNIQTHY